MIKNGNQAPLAVFQVKARFAVQMKWFCGLMILSLLVALAPARAEEADEQYLRVFNIIGQADSLNKSGQAAQARTKYQEAQAVLFDLKKSNPTWNTKAVAFRLNYVADKIAALSPQAAPGAAPTGLSGLPAGMQVRLLEAGAEPQKALRLQPRPGDKQTVIMTAKMSMGAGEVTGGMIKMPGVKMTLGVAPKSVTPEGDISYELVVEEVGIVEEAGTVPQMVEAMKASMEGLKGMVVHSTIADRGYVKKAELKIPAGTRPEVRAAMEQMKDTFAEGEIVFPEEAVGAGARWEVKQKVKEEGATIDATSTYQLVSIEGDVLTITASSDHRAANQKVANPMVPDAKADLVKLSGTSTAKATVDLTRIMPTQGTAEERSEKTLSLTIGAQKQTMTIKSETTSRIESK